MDFKIQMSILISIFLLITISCVFAGSCSCGDSYYTMSDEQKKQKEAENWNKRGIELYNQGKYNEAIDCFDKAVDLVDEYRVCPTFCKISSLSLHSLMGSQS